MARYRDVNLVTKCSRAFFYLAIPFRDHSHVPEEFRSTETRPCWPAIRFLELENRCAGNRTVGSNPTVGLLFADCHAPRGDLLETWAFGGNADTWCIAVETVQINCEPGLSIKSNAEPLQSQIGKDVVFFSDRSTL